jgi:hypothetical protein
MKVSNGSTFPPDYAGKPFQDSVYQSGAQVIPGKVECAHYDLGGSGVAYYAQSPLNHGSGELNQQADHQRPHATPYFWDFRKNEGVDISYVKDMADLNHPNSFTPFVNQLYIGWTEDGEWCNYTIQVQQAGRYRISALYAGRPNILSFSVNNRPASECQLPIFTGGFHNWHKAAIGTLVFAQTGLHLLALHYKAGNNLAYFEFELIEDV